MATAASGLLAELPSSQLKMCFRRSSPGSHGAPNHLLLLTSLTGNFSHFSCPHSHNPVGGSDRHQYLELLKTRNLKKKKKVYIHKQEVVSVRLSPDNNEVLRLKTRDAGAP